jgi:UDP-glucose 4-epimerase
MRVTVTGSSGHLGEALVRTLRGGGREVVSIDVLPSPFTTHVGSITDRDFVRRCMAGVETVFHAATLHKPHVATHSRQAFVDVNITGTLNLLEEAASAGVKALIYTSTTSVFGDALIPPPGEPAAWITEDVRPVPKNIYGVTKSAAEDLCQLFHRNQRLPCVVLRTSRFFPEADDDPGMRERYADENVKANEFLHRRVDVEDVVSAHLLAAERAPRLGFRKYIVSATTPFTREDLPGLRRDAAGVVRRLFPAFEAEYARRGWRMFDRIDRVYVDDLARRELGWRPVRDFGYVLERLARGEAVTGALARSIGSKGYHREFFGEGATTSSGPSSGS